MPLVGGPRCASPGDLTICCHAVMQSCGHAVLRSCCHAATLPTCQPDNRFDFFFFFSPTGTAVRTFLKIMHKKKRKKKPRRGVNLVILFLYVLSVISPGGGRTGGVHPSVHPSVLLSFFPSWERSPQGSPAQLLTGGLFYPHTNWYAFPRFCHPR